MSETFLQVESNRMTAGSGIIHQEMPKPVNDKMGGFQLWVNLPQSHKMMPPRYQEITASEIPVSLNMDAIDVEVTCGEFGGVQGPAGDIIRSPDFFDVTIRPGIPFSHHVRPGDVAAGYVIGGTGTFDLDGSEVAVSCTMAQFENDWSSVEVLAVHEGMMFL
ncbi:MAG: pirin family protein [Methanomicrobiales archaeon]|nr:pirin family protein [Methanomicrobiales archaeon]